METMKSGQRMTLNPTSDKSQPDLFLALWHESMKSKFINTNQFSLNWDFAAAWCNITLTSMEFLLYNQYNIFRFVIATK